MKRIFILAAALAAFGIAFAKPAVRNGRTGALYDTIQEGVDAAEGGDTLTMIRDVATTTPVKIVRDVKLDLGGHVLTSTPDESDSWTFRTGDSGSPEVTLCNGRIVSSEDDWTRQRGGIRVNATKLTLRDIRLEVYGCTAIQVTGGTSTLALEGTHVFSVTMLDDYPCILMYTAGQTLKVDADSTVVSDARKEGVIQTRGVVDIAGLVSNSCATAKSAIHGCSGSTCRFTVRDGGRIVTAGGYGIWCNSTQSGTVVVEEGGELRSAGPAVCGTKCAVLRVDEGARLTSAGDACVDISGASSRLEIAGGLFTAKDGLAAIRVGEGVPLGFVSGGEFSGAADGASSMSAAFVAEKEGRAGRWVRSTRRGYVRPKWKRTGRLPFVR